jgi:hypothetical protein
MILIYFLYIVILSLIKKEIYIFKFKKEYKNYFFSFILKILN